MRLGGLARLGWEELLHREDEGEYDCGFGEGGASGPKVGGGACGPEAGGAVGPDAGGDGACGPEVSEAAARVAMLAGTRQVCCGSRPAWMSTSRPKAASEQTWGSAKHLDVGKAAGDDAGQQETLRQERTLRSRGRCRGRQRGQLKRRP